MFLSNVHPKERCRSKVLVVFYGFVDARVRDIRTDRRVLCGVLLQQSFEPVRRRLGLLRAFDALPGRKVVLGRVGWPAMSKLKARRMATAHGFEP
jgi:hypothetical protein